MRVNPVYVGYVLMAAAGLGVFIQIPVKASVRPVEPVSCQSRYIHYPMTEINPTEPQGYYWAPRST